MEELIDCLDEFGNKTGVVKKKSDIKKDGDYHRVIAVLVVNGDNILIHQRSISKKVYPNLWSLFVRGHVQAGESSIDACKREIKEEIGIDVNEDELEFLYTLKEKAKKKDYIENMFYDTYILRKDIDIKDITIQKEELNDIKFINIDEVKKQIESGNKEYVPNDEDYKRIFEYLKN